MWNFWCGSWGNHLQWVKIDPILIEEFSFYKLSYNSYAREELLCIIFFPSYCSLSVTSCYHEKKLMHISYFFNAEKVQRWFGAMWIEYWDNHHLSESLLEGNTLGLDFLPVPWALYHGVPVKGLLKVEMALVTWFYILLFRKELNNCPMQLPIQNPIRHLSGTCFSMVLQEQGKQWLPESLLINLYEIYLIYPLPFFFLSCIAYAMLLQSSKSLTQFTSQVTLHKGCSSWLITSNFWYVFHFCCLAFNILVRPWTLKIQNIMHENIWTSSWQDMFLLEKEKGRYW